MKNLRLLIVTAALMAVALSASAQSKIASVDMKKIFNNYYKTKLAQAVIDKEKADLSKDIKDMSEALTKARADYKLHLGQCILYPATVHTNDWVLRRETGHFE